MKKIQQFLAHEAAPGLILVAAALLAVIAENSAFRALYQWFLSIPITIQFGEFVLQKPHLLFINDGLMAIFFLLVGMEIKRELVVGELSSIKKASLPIVAALGGMVLPALIFISCTWGGDPYAVQGWAIPAATDIAFSLGVLALCGTAVPASLKVFLTALAIIDDMGAIIIIALFYSEKIVLGALFIAFLAMLSLVALNLRGVRSLVPYVLLGLVLWASVLKSGAHATIAGVLLAATIPLRFREGSSPLEEFEHALKPWVLWVILPLFAFANSGVPLEGFSLVKLLEPIPLGIVLGLFIGKQFGIFGATALYIRLGGASLPKEATWFQLYGVSVVAGIGFTMSLFIASLAYSGEEFVVATRVGVLTGSILSGVFGTLIVRWAGRRRF